LGEADCARVWEWDDSKLIRDGLHALHDLTATATPSVLQFVAIKPRATALQQFEKRKNPFRRREKYFRLAQPDFKSKPFWEDRKWIGGV